MKLTLLLVFLGLAGCASHAPPQASGQWHPLNVGMWAGENTLTNPPPGE